MMTETIERTPKPSKGLARAQQFRKLALGLEATIADKRRPMSQNPTPKRNREYGERLHEADNLHRLRLALLALADGHERGTIPAGLAALKSKAEIAPLIYKGTLSGGYYDCIPCPDYRDTSPAAKLVQTMIANGLASIEAGAREAETDRLERDALLRGYPGFFPTPRDIARRVAELALLQPGQRLLEPSAGTGRLAEAALAEVPDLRITLLERVDDLRRILTRKGFNTDPCDDFMQWNGALTSPSILFDRIVMNPPFENGQDAEHVSHAFRMLKPGGRLVAIVSAGLFFRSDRRAVAFRQLLDEHAEDPQGMELGTDAFRESGTGVNCRIVVLNRD
jgi:SAM-dependent methyltransferase